MIWATLVYCVVFFVFFFVPTAHAFDLKHLLQGKPEMTGVNYYEEDLKRNRLSVTAERCELDELLACEVCQNVAVQYESAGKKNLLLIRANQAKLDPLSALVTFKGDVTLSGGDNLRLKTDYLRYFYSRGLFSTYSFEELMLQGERLAADQILYDLKTERLHLFSPKRNESRLFPLR